MTAALQDGDMERCAQAALLLCFGHAESIMPLCQTSTSTSCVCSWRSSALQGRMSCWTTQQQLLQQMQGELAAPCRDATVVSHF